MKNILNILPALCFFLTYKLAGNDLITATWALLISSGIAMTAYYFMYRTMSRFQIIFICALLIFALPTIIFNDTDFIKYKVSAVNIILAVTFLVIQFGFKKDIASVISGVRNPIPDSVWRKATLATAVFLLFCAGLNYVLAFRLPDLFSGITPAAAEEIWVNYKTYGNAILNVIFTMILFFWMYSRLDSSEKAQLERLMESMTGKQIPSGPENSEDRKNGK
ncbi:septation protein IspZ [Succinimonas amylolytica]|uniref:septation protein IspZ n=1 Tax=Succinimonas amylolytica TaxID=83769 RepID=UPI000373E47F|nr:septation protein IspZ [Succinimonas amylolytica]